jgi:hypothetical protein
VDMSYSHFNMTRAWCSVSLGYIVVVAVRFNINLRLNTHCSERDNRPSLHPGLGKHVEIIQSNVEFENRLDVREYMKSPSTADPLIEVSTESKRNRLQVWH